MKTQTFVLTQKRSLIRYAFVCATGAILLLASVSCQREQVTSTTTKPLTFQFGWLPDAHQVGFWVAQSKGYYRDAGLDVKFLPGGLDSNPVKAVVSNAADMGQAGGIEQVITPISEGLPITAIAAIHRDTPHALISTESSPIRTAKDLQGKTIAVAYGDAAEVLFDAYVSASHINQGSINIVPFRFDLTPLLNGKVDAVTGFSTDQPATLQSKGKKPVVLRYSQQGVRSYGYTLFCTTTTLQKRSADINAFLSASRHGWEDAFADPKAAIEILSKQAPSISRQVELSKLTLIKPLMCDSMGHLSPWNLERSRVEQAEKYLESHGQLKSPPKFNDIVSPEFRLQQ